MRGLALLCCLLAGCASTQPPTIIVSKDLAYGALFWRSEIERTTGTRNFILIAGHGNDIGSEWHIFPTVGAPIGMTDFVRAIRCEHPTTPIWLFSCNPGHRSLDIPGVAFATEEVWAMPDRFSANPPGKIIGRADEFTICVKGAFSATTQPYRK